jgi:hypothetical protein
MAECRQNQLNNEERAELDEWEKQNLDGSFVCTSDWPGWEKHIGRRPGRHRMQ